MQNKTILKKIKALEKLVEEYRPLTRLDEFHSEKAEEIREQIQESFYEIEDSIYKALGGNPIVSVFGTRYPVFETALSGANSTAAFHTIKHVPQLLKKATAYYKKGNKVSKPRPDSSATYISKEIITLVEKLKEHGFDTKKLLSLIEELNFNYASQNPYATLSLIRAIIDHIPPLLGFSNYKESAKNYKWPSRSDKNYALNLVNDKHISHDSLHRQITNERDLITMDVIPNAIYLNTVLRECTKSKIQYEKFKRKETGPKKKQETETLKTNAPLVIANLQSTSGGPKGYRVEILLQNVGKALASLEEIVIGGKHVDLKRYPPLVPGENVVKITLQFDKTEREGFQKLPVLYIRYKNPIDKVAYFTRYEILLENRADGLSNIANFINLDFEKAKKS